MQKLKTVSELLADRELDLSRLIQRSGLSKRVVQAIVAGQYSASPEQRRRIADVFGILPDAIRWGHSVPVEHMYGHGPQFGRSP